MLKWSSAPPAPSSSSSSSSPSSSSSSPHNNNNNSSPQSLSSSSFSSPPQPPQPPSHRPAPILVAPSPSSSSSSSSVVSFAGPLLSRSGSARSITPSHTTNSHVTFATPPPPPVPTSASVTASSSPAPASNVSAARLLFKGLRSRASSDASSKGHSNNDPAPRQIEQQLDAASSVPPATSNPLSASFASAADLPYSAPIASAALPYQPPPLPSSASSIYKFKPGGMAKPTPGQILSEMHAKDASSGAVDPLTMMMPKRTRVSAGETSASSGSAATALASYRSSLGSGPRSPGGSPGRPFSNLSGKTAAHDSLPRTISSSDNRVSSRSSTPLALSSEAQSSSQPDSSVYPNVAKHGWAAKPGPSSHSSPSRNSQFQPVTTSLERRRRTSASIPNDPWTPAHTDVDGTLIIKVPRPPSLVSRTSRASSSRRASRYVSIRQRKPRFNRYRQSQATQSTASIGSGANAERMRARHESVYSDWQDADEEDIPDEYEIVDDYHDYSPTNWNPPQSVESSRRNSALRSLTTSPFSGNTRKISQSIEHLIGRLDKAWETAAAMEAGKGGAPQIALPSIVSPFVVPSMQTIDLLPPPTQPRSQNPQPIPLHPLWPLPLPSSIPEPVVTRVVSPPMQPSSPPRRTSVSGKEKGKMSTSAAAQALLEGVLSEMGADTRLSFDPKVLEAFIRGEIITLPRQGPIEPTTPSETGTAESEFAKYYASESVASAEEAKGSAQSTPTPGASASRAASAYARLDDLIEEIKTENFRNGPTPTDSALDTVPNVFPPTSAAYSPLGPEHIDELVASDADEDWEDIDDGISRRKIPDLRILQQLVVEWSPPPPVVSPDLLKSSVTTVSSSYFPASAPGQPSPSPEPRFKILNMSGANGDSWHTGTEESEDGEVRLSRGRSRRGSKRHAVIQVPEAVPEDADDGDVPVPGSVLTDDSTSNGGPRPPVVRLSILVADSAAPPSTRGSVAPTSSSGPPSQHPPSVPPPNTQQFQPFSTSIRQPFSGGGGVSTPMSLEESRHLSRTAGGYSGIGSNATPSVGSRASAHSSAAASLSSARSAPDDVPYRSPFTSGQMPSASPSSRTSNSNASNTSGAGPKRSFFSAIRDRLQGGGGGGGVAGVLAMPTGSAASVGAAASGANLRRSGSASAAVRRRRPSRGSESGSTMPRPGQIGIVRSASEVFDGTQGRGFATLPRQM